MSHVAHSQNNAFRLRSRAMLALWAGAVAVAAAITLFFVTVSDDSVPASQLAVPSAVVERTPGIRYDGGPEEGSHAIRHTRTQVAASAGTRYDGGPDEGTRGIGR